jgi:hypothetical protein
MDRTEPDEKVKDLKACASLKSGLYREVGIDRSSRRHLERVQNLPQTCLISIVLRSARTIIETQSACFLLMLLLVGHVMVSL